MLGRSKDARAERALYVLVSYHTLLRCSTYCIVAVMGGLLRDKENQEFEEVKETVLAESVHVPILEE